MNAYDVIVVGAGVVGASAALGFAKQGHQVALIESAETMPDSQTGHADTPYDLRVFAISYASEQLFRHLGVWENIQARRACAYTDMHVWDQGGSGEIHFGCEDIAQDHLGHIIENAVIVASLMEAVEQESRIDLRLAARIETVQWPDQDGVSKPAITLANGDELAANLVVAADGAHSYIRQSAGITVDGGSYDQQGIVAVVKTQHSHQNTAWQRFLDTGPLAFLPLSNGQSSIVWSADQPNADKLLALDEADFSNELAKAFEFKLGAVELCSQRAAFPLCHQHASEYTRKGLALIGDAAHVIHPLAGQGVNLGLLDVATLLEELDKKSLSATTPLRRYARRRRHANQISLSSMTALQKLFQSSSSAFRQLRNQGLTLAGEIAPLRRQFARHAAGLEGDVPKISR